MANLKEIRNRIASVTSTRQITSAMKMVSAAKLRKAQNAILGIRPYANKLNSLLADLSLALSKDADIVFARKSEEKNILIVVVSSNRGLCGAFNANVFKQVLHLTQSVYKQQFDSGNVSFVTVGKKAADLLRRKNFNIVADYSAVYENLTYDEAAKIAYQIMQWFKEGKYDVVDIVYNKFKNAAVQTLETERFLPVSPKLVENAFPPDYIYEPSIDFIVESLYPKSLTINFYKAVLDSFASEHGARMTAMHKATDNATELIKDLTLSYNKARQAAITKEILEIVGGAEALKG